MWIGGDEDRRVNAGHGSGRPLYSWTDGAAVSPSQTKDVVERGGAAAARATPTTRASADSQIRRRTDRHTGRRQTDTDRRNQYEKDVHSHAETRRCAHEGTWTHTQAYTERQISNKMISVDRQRRKRG